MVKSLVLPSVFQRFLLSISFLSSFAASVVSPANWFYNSTRPLVIGRRGSFGQFPEYSIGGYMDAYLNGADFIELTV